MLEEGDRISEYTLKRFLGRGSYGDVWLAEKSIELAEEGIPFALKFLPNQSGKGAPAESVKNEVRTWIKAGNHFNIVPVYDGFTYGRFLVIVSEYVDGGSLRDWLVPGNGKAPSVEKAVEMMRGILRGLTHLHYRKIIHRDLKPENILIKEGAPKITDFGVSRVMKTLSQNATLRFTKGAGSPLYMPPEAFSEGYPTAQLDIWSAGVIFYEMLSGYTPFDANNVTALVNEITNEEPKALPSTLPEQLQEIVSISLAKNVSHRFQTSAEMSEALDRAWVEMQQRAVWPLEAIGNGVQIERERRLKAAMEGRQYDEEQKRREDIVGGAGEVEDETYPARPEAQPKEESINNPQQGRLEEIQRETRRKRIKKMAGAGVAVVSLGTIIGVISLNRPPSPGLPDQSSNTNQPNAEAYFKRGLECDAKEDYDCVINNLTKAIELNPRYAVAYFNRANAYYSKRDLDQAIKDYNKAIELNPLYSRAYNNRGDTYNAKGDYDQAIKDFNKAIELDPLYIFAYNNRGIAYKSKGDFDQAIKDYNKAIELDSQYADAYFNRGNAYKYKGDLDQAIRDYNKALELKPRDADVFYMRGLSYAIKGDLHQAIKDYDKAIEFNPRDADAFLNRGRAYGRLGQTEKATADRQKYEELSAEK
jgi:serine/threonine protein kinase